jgi:hypothetical protein
MRRVRKPVGRSYLPRAAVPLDFNVTFQAASVPMRRAELVPRRSNTTSLSEPYQNDEPNPHMPMRLPIPTRACPPRHPRSARPQADATDPSSPSRADATHRHQPMRQPCPQRPKATTRDEIAPRRQAIPRPLHATTPLALLRPEATAFTTPIRPEMTSRVVPAEATNCS